MQQRRSGRASGGHPPPVSRHRGSVGRGSQTSSKEAPLMGERRMGSGRRAVGGRKVGLLALLPVAAVMVVLFAGSASSQTTTCLNPATLGSGSTGSSFEIEGNLVVNNAACVDWLTGGTGTAYRTGV